MPQTNLLTRSGNKIIATFDNKQIGLLQEIRFQETLDPQEASGIGNIHVREWVPTLQRLSITARWMVLNKQSMYNAGVGIPENGDDALNGLVFDIQILDAATGELLRKFIGCSYASGDVEVQKHQIVFSNASFLALDSSGTM